LTTRSTGKAETQQRILTAATALFMEHGYAGTTISAVAERAEVSRATVFWHFSDKAGLFREAFSRLLAPFGDTIDQEIPGLDPEKCLYRQLAMSEEFSREHGDEITAFVHWAIENPDHRDAILGALLKLNQRFAEAITRSVAALAPEGADAKLLAQGLILAFDANLILSLFAARPRAAQERRAAIDAYVELIVRNRTR
jgi:AcrR family transcriptional regulator